MTCTTSATFALAQHFLRIELRRLAGVVIVARALEEPRHLRQEIGMNAELTETLDVERAPGALLFLRQPVFAQHALEIVEETQLLRRVAPHFEYEAVRRQGPVGLHDAQCGHL